MEDQTSEPERRADGRAVNSTRAFEDGADEPDAQAGASSDEPDVPQALRTIAQRDAGTYASQRRAPNTRARRTKQLTRREREVASLIGAGLTSRHVAERLMISERTVDSHAEHIRDKLGLHSRAQIAAWAVNEGLVEHPPGGCSWIRSCR